MDFEYQDVDTFNAADYFVDRHIREGRKDKTAILCEDRSFTYGTVAIEVNRFGNALKKAHWLSCPCMKAGSRTAAPGYWRSSSASAQNV